MHTKYIKKHHTACVAVLGISGRQEILVGATLPVAIGSCSRPLLS